MSVIYAIDPGSEQSALVILWPDGTVSGGIHDNKALLFDLRLRVGVPWTAHLVIEQIASYGMPVGAEVFATCVWIGRFIEAWTSHAAPSTWSLLPRKDVNLELCGSLRAKDAHIRQALIDRYGGKAAAIGTKKAPGPLYGLKSHCWAALAVAETYRAQHGIPTPRPGAIVPPGAAQEAE